MKKLLSITTIVILTASGRADVVLNVEDVSVGPSETGFFEVFLTSTDGVFPSIAIHQVRVNLLDASSGITFVSGGPTAARTYLGPSAAPTSQIRTSRTAIDSGDFTLLGSVNAFDNAGLLRVGFMVPAGTPQGDYRVEIDSSPSRTFMSDNANDFVPFTTRGGVISVTAIPEPASIPIVGAVCLATIMGWRQWRRRRAIS